MDCVAWMASEINANLALVDSAERWYEDLQTAAISHFSSRESCQYIPSVSTAQLQETTSNHNVRHQAPVIHQSFVKEVEKAMRREGRRAFVCHSETSSAESSPTRIPRPTFPTSDLEDAVEDYLRDVHADSAGVQSNSQQHQDNSAQNVESPIQHHHENANDLHHHAGNVDDRVQPDADNVNQDKDLHSLPQSSVSHNTATNNKEKREAKEPPCKLNVKRRRSR